MHDPTSESIKSTSDNTMSAEGYKNNYSGMRQDASCPPYPWPPVESYPSGGKGKSRGFPPMTQYGMPHSMHHQPHLHHHHHHHQGYASHHHHHHHHHGHHSHHQMHLPSHHHHHHHQHHHHHHHHHQQQHYSVHYPYYSQPTPQVVPKKDVKEFFKDYFCTRLLKKEFRKGEGKFDDAPVQECIAEFCKIVNDVVDKTLKKQDCDRLEFHSSCEVFTQKWLEKTCWINSKRLRPLLDEELTKSGIVVNWIGDELPPKTFSSTRKGAKGDGENGGVGHRGQGNHEVSHGKGGKKGGKKGYNEDMNKPKIADFGLNVGGSKRQQMKKNRENEKKRKAEEDKCRKEEEARLQAEQEAQAQQAEEEAARAAEQAQAEEADQTQEEEAPDAQEQPEEEEEQKPEEESKGPETEA